MAFTGEEAIKRFKENEKRVNDFVNTATGYTTTPETGSVQVESVQEFIARKNTEINTGADNILEQSEAARDVSHLWAVGAEDEKIADGVNPPGYSAFHWAQKAAVSSPSKNSVIGFYYNDIKDELHFVNESTGGIYVPGKMEEWTILYGNISARITILGDVILTV